MSDIHSEKSAADEKDATARKAPVPEGFTLSLALVDAVPVLLFGAAAVVFGSRVESPVFVAGAVLALLGGAGKVCWKLVIALAKQNLAWLGKQMRITMPVGFALMLVGCALRWSAVATFAPTLLRLPSAALLVAWVACMVAMGWFAGHLEQTDVRSNWVEQLTNACGQACLLAALLLAA